MKFDRAKYFNAVRPIFGALAQGQVDGQNVILDVWEESFRERTPITQLAVCFATAFHETNKTMQPIKELGGIKYLTLNYDIAGKNPARARKMGNVKAGDGPRYCGRGLVQLTWYVNYLRAELELKKLGLIPQDMSFIKNPELVMEPRIAALIMFLGMEEGWFTGKTLDQLVDPNIDGDEHADAVQSRRIINGTDRAELIAGYSDQFLKALRAATGAA